MRLSKAGRRLADQLLDKYEASVTYRGENKVTQSFAVAPEAVFAAYRSDYADVTEIAQFEAEMRALEEEGLIRIERRNGEIARLTAAAGDGVWEKLYALTGRTGRREMEAVQLRFYRGQLSVFENEPGAAGDELRVAERERSTADGPADACASGGPTDVSAADSPGGTIASDSPARACAADFCRAQIARLEGGKKPVMETEDAERVLACLHFLAGNRSEVLERELSIALYRDTKTFEKQVRGRVCRLLERTGRFDSLLEGVDAGREKEQIILAEFRVSPNPTYVYVKGRARLTFADGTQLELTRGSAVGLPSERLEALTGAEIADGTVMTVENLTSFHRLDEDGIFYIYLAGYHNTARQRLIRSLAALAPGLAWQHAGDIDPDGFYILEHLRRGTGLDIQPYRMDVETLRRFTDYTKPLTENDRVKAGSLSAAGKYADVMAYMIEHNCKLEQEIVSWAPAG